MISTRKLGSLVSVSDRAGVVSDADGVLAKSVGSEE